MGPSWRFVLWLGVWAPQTANAESADCRAVSGPDGAYIKGTGTGADFESAKAKAVADAYSFFGHTVVATGEARDSATSVDMDSSVSTVIQATAKGVEVLSQCASGHGLQVIVGVRKATLRRLIEDAARRRQEWGHGPEFAKDSARLARIRAEESKDREVWTLLGYPEMTFPDAGLASIKSVATRPATYRLKVSGEVATLTADAVRQRLAGGGATFSESAAAELLWRCEVTTGVAMAEVTRYRVTCALTGSLAFDPIEIEGISPHGGVVPDAAAKIQLRLRTVPEDGR